MQVGCRDLASRLWATQLASTRILHKVFLRDKFLEISPCPPTHVLRDIGADLIIDEIVDVIEQMPRWYWQKAQLEMAFWVRLARIQIGVLETSAALIDASMLQDTHCNVRRAHSAECG